MPTERSRFAQGVAARAWPAALFLLALVAAAVAVEAGSGSEPEVQLEITATTPSTWSVTADGVPAMREAGKDPSAWAGSIPHAAKRIAIAARPESPVAHVAMRIHLRCGARQAETTVWGGTAELDLATLLHGDHE